MLDAIKNIQNEINELGDLKFNELKGNTALIVVDMVKGFCTVGPLSSTRSTLVVNPILQLNSIMKDNKKVYFIDSHNADSIEFKSYPVHCVKESEEEELIDELKECSNDSTVTIIKKNSVNGFHSNKFKEWLNANRDIDNFIITGVCTDICVEAFAITLLTYFNEVNEEKTIIVPINTVETFDLGLHNADLMNIMSLYKMKSNGIKVVKSITI